MIGNLESGVNARRPNTLTLRGYSGAGNVRGVFVSRSAFEVIADKILKYSLPLPFVRRMWTRFPFGSVERRVKYGIWPRPHYAYGVWQAANLAKNLNLKAISVAEFGVAGGRGLLALEDIATLISRAVGVRIDVFGFDSGEGMPAPLDYRDLPFVWDKGFYKMDVQKLRTAISSAKLILGDVKKTIPSFMADSAIAPLGFISFDLDYYSSTKNALELFDVPERKWLPRVYCYFDDVLWPETSCHNEFIGELCAIREFNESHVDMVLAPIHLLQYMRVHPEVWNEQIYVLHEFHHPLYCQNITPKQEKYTQLPL